MSSLFQHQVHPRVEQRQTESPTKVAEQHKSDTTYQRFNKRLAVGITANVGTMTSAYLFCLLAFLSLPAVLSGLGGPFDHLFPPFLVRASLIALIAWIAQTFLQLVLLPIIIVGQNVQAEAADKRAEATYEDADAVLHEALQIQAHLEAQDAAIEQILAALGRGAVGTGDAPAPVTPS
jgi:uncharacterized membrane protein